jgi:hypothetical protein
MLRRVYYMVEHRETLLTAGCQQGFAMVVLITFR